MNEGGSQKSFENKIQLVLFSNSSTYIHVQHSATANVRAPHEPACNISVPYTGSHAAKHTATISTY